MAVTSLGIAAEIGTTCDRVLSQLESGPGRGGGFHELDPLADPRWDDFVESHPAASAFHTSAWLKALRATYNYEPVVISSSPSGHPLVDGLVFCRIRSWLTGNRLVSLPFSDHCEPLVSTMRLDRTLSAMRNTDKWEYIEIRPCSQGEQPPPGIGKVSTYAWHMMDLEPSPDALFRRFHQDCIQRKIRRAEREKLTYETGNSEHLLSAFYALFVKTRRRHGLPPQPNSWFHHLAEAFQDKLQVRLVSHKGRPVASIITLKHRRTVTYKYGCSDPSSHHLGGMPLLLWRTIQEAKNERMVCLDLGRSNLDNTGLIQFKNRWGARCQLLTYFRIGSKLSSKQDDTRYPVLRRVARLAPEWFLRCSGNLLYRHLG